jgi:hypothetical protein
MRYWLYLVAKISAAIAALYALQVGVEHMFRIPPIRLDFKVETQFCQISYVKPPVMFLHDMPFTFAIIGVWLFSAGVLYAVVWDHRRRCRSCFRRLIMPVATGSWGHMFTFGRPATEWICPYGHGTLRIEELQITGKGLPDWEAHDDNIWKELESYK